MRYHTFLFDLDGTLTDPKEGITRSVAYALERFGIQADPDSLTPYIGPPLAEAFTLYHGLSKEDSVKAVEVYRERFSVIGLYENQVYPGIPELLAGLKQAGGKVIVATSKPTVFSQKILDRFGLTPYIDFLAGSELDHSRVGKAEVIAYAEEKTGISDKTGAVMIGDRKFDIQGGKERGMATVGVLYGYGSREELTEAGADVLAESVENLKTILFR